MIKRANDLPLSSFPPGLLTASPNTEKTILLHWIRSEFNLPKSVSDLCDQFFLRVWTGSYVEESVQNGILHGRSDSWIAHFQSTPEVVKSARQVACSFREYDGKKYVVIKVWKDRISSEEKDNGNS